MIQMCADSWAAMYRQPSSASSADDMKFFMICEMVSMAPLFGGNTVFFYKTKWPPSQLRASGSLRYLSLM